MASPNVSSQILFEGTVGTRDFWLKALNASSQDLLYLQSQLILRKVSGGDAESLRLDFVGLICCRENAFFAVPKIFREQKADFKQAIQLTLACLQRYERKNSRAFKSSEAGVGEFFDEAGTIVDMFLSILEWTLEHGFHQAEEKYRSDEFSNISWQETIGKKYPIHFGKSILYGDPIGYRTLPTHNELAQMQACALLDLAKKLDVLSQIWLPDYDPAYEAAQEISNDAEAIHDRGEMRRLVDELQFSSNRDKDRALLDLLSRWLNLDYKVSSKVQLYGTNAFHVIWEDICIFLFHALGVPEQHSEIASQPIYTDGKSQTALHPQRPDILIEVNSDVQIADAKWYDIDHGDLPHLEDVIKQLVYQMSIEPARHVKNNVFLMPGLNGKSWSLVGQFEMNHKEKTDHRFPAIGVIRLDWLEMANAYSKLLLPSWGQNLLRFISKNNER